VDEQTTFTERELLVVRVACRIHGFELMPDAIDDYGFTDEEKGHVRAVIRALFAAQAQAERDAKPAKRLAMRLLRSFLTDEQRAQLRRGRSFRVVGSAGGLYRLWPYGGGVERVERHGSRWFAVRSLCLHDYAADAPDRQRIPRGDLSLQHLLLLRADEPAFLAAANTTERDLLWNGDWLRRLAAQRRVNAQIRDEVAAMRAAEEEIAA